jgi:hypothetical protein
VNSIIAAHRTILVQLRDLMADPPDKFPFNALTAVLKNVEAGYESSPRQYESRRSPRDLRVGRLPCWGILLLRL